MSFDSTFFYFLATPAYFLAMLFYLFAAVFKPESRARSAEALGITASVPRPGAMNWGSMATIVACIGVMFAFVGVVLRVTELGRASDWAIQMFLPVTSTYETLTFMSFLIPFVYLLMEIKYKFYGVGAIITGLAFVLLTFSSLPDIAPRTVAAIVPSLQSYWLVIHVLFMITGISLFTVGFGASALLLIRRYVYGAEPASLKKLEELSYKANAFGFPFYGIGGLIFGGIWAKHAWGAYWEWDPKETAMLIAWLSYAIYLHVRLHWGWRDLKVAWTSVAAYCVVLFTWLGINYFVGGLHSFV
jgi:ABC-type transport system involved in cytochrome c biogenesis permease subunit